MAENKKSNNKFFAVFINLLGLISAVLYFAGWMYRLAYYSRFELSVIDLNFSFESYLLLPVVILFTDLVDVLFSDTSLTKVLCTILFISSIYLVLRSLQLIFQKLFTYIKQKLAGTKWLVNEFQRLHDLIEQFNVIEISLTVFVLFILFGIAWYRGFLDGTRDIYEETSILPSVKIISGAESLVKKEALDKREWRLLHRHDDWIYLVAPKLNESENPPQVLLVTKGESGDKILELKTH